MYIYIDKIVKTCILMCVCIIEFVVVLLKMLSGNALSVVSGTCLFADCVLVPWYLVNALMMTS
jgi:hypothetical protein